MESVVILVVAGGLLAYLFFSLVRIRPHRCRNQPFRIDEKDGQPIWKVPFSLTVGEPPLEDVLGTALIVATSGIGQAERRIAHCRLA